MICRMAKYTLARRGMAYKQAIQGEHEKENLIEYEQHFKDKCQIVVNAGKGGDGCMSYIRTQYSNRIPSGGNGGNGGSVWMQSTSRLNNLYDIRRAHFRGNDGNNGRNQMCEGRDGKDITINIPVGTTAYVIEGAKELMTDSTAKRNLVADFDEPGKRVLISKGGIGGRGNHSDKRPDARRKGTLGELKVLELELKLIADIGMLGYPNAGKSTLLAALTRAFPKIAPYPFTTKRPYIGHINFVDGLCIKIADLPGIIQGAHHNRGLGLEFLRHIERTKGILYVLDGTGFDEEEPTAVYNMLIDEVRRFNSEILTKPSVIVFNKCDKFTEHHEKRLEKFRKIAHTQVIPISARESLNLEELVNHLRTLLLRHNYLQI